MKFSEITTLEQVVELGTIPEVVANIQALVGPLLKVVAETHEDLLALILLLKEKWVDLIPGPFVRRQDEVVFCLTKLEGKIRNDLLGLTEEHFRDKALAKQWYRGLASIVHEDRLNGDREPFQLLKKLYDQITFVDDADDEEEGNE